MSKEQDQASAWLGSVIRKHLAANARKYTWNCYVGGVQHTLLGLQRNLAPVEGKVVEQSDAYWLLKTGRASFFVVARELCASALEVGSMVQLTPYCRRHFDGHPFHAPRKSVSGGVGFSTIVLGETVSRIPVDGQALRCPELKDLIRIVEEEKVDAVRTVGQVLIDAGAHLEPVQVQDVDEASGDDIFATPPSLTFRVSNAKHDGWLRIAYERGLDALSVDLLDRDRNVVDRRHPLFITLEGLSELGGVVSEMVDVGDWKFAKVALLKPAGRSARSTALVAA